MHDKEAIDMMQRCVSDITSLRATIDRLKPKADAYDNLAIVLHLLPQRSEGAGEDLVRTLKRRIEEIKAAAEKPATPTE